MSRRSSMQMALNPSVVADRQETDRARLIQAASAGHAGLCPLLPKVSAAALDAFSEPVSAVQD